MRTKDEILKSIFARTTLGIKFGLDNITNACEDLGNPQKSFRAIHVAGTNGKGSVCAYLESILRCQGYSTGLFTSPHIFGFEERFVLNGLPIETAEWLRVYCDIEEIVNRYNLTFFEISTLLAFELFKRKKIEWAVVETGLGGRLDSTNIIKPDVSIITNIGIDHIDYLGDNIISIAKEKLGIVKENVPLILGIQTYSEICDVARSICDGKKAPYIPVDLNEVSDISINEQGSVFTCNSIKYQTGLSGLYQIQNAMCAIKAMEKIRVVKKKSIVAGIKNTNIKGRFQEILIKNTRFVFDVAHNIQAVGEHCALLKQKFNHRSITIIAGIMKDKNTRQMLELYVKTADNLILIYPKTSRAADPKDLIKKIPDVYLDKVSIIKDAKDAVMAIQKDKNTIVSVTGSFYTVCEIVSALGIVL